MRLSGIICALEQIAPPSLAESWDNVGLLAGDPNQEISRILLTIDYSAAVAEEGRTEKCDLVIAYHPPIFQALKRVVAGNPIFDAIRRGVAIYSPHTALDVADGGTNDMLADVLGLTDRRPLKNGEGKGTQYKLVVFVPMRGRGGLRIIPRAVFGRRERGRFSGRRGRSRRWDKRGGLRRLMKSGWKRWFRSAKSMRSFGH